jgi:hypothetical protein
MSAKAVGCMVEDKDRPRLQSLVDDFGDSDRAEFSACDVRAHDPADAWGENAAAPRASTRRARRSRSTAD